MMKAGIYWVGDLCYVLDGKDKADQWDQVCDLFFKGGDGEYLLDADLDIQFAMGSTAYGDGTYLDREAREYPVDSGTIGCVLLEKIAPCEYGNVIDIPEDFILDVSDGKISLIGLSGKAYVEIDTDPEYEEEPWEELDYDPDEN